MQADYHFVLPQTPIVERFSIRQPANGLIFRTDLQYNLLLEREV